MDINDKMFKVEMTEKDYKKFSNFVKTRNNVDAKKNGTLYFDVEKISDLKVFDGINVFFKVNFDTLVRIHSIAEAHYNNIISSAKRKEKHQETEIDPLPLPPGYRSVDCGLIEVSEETDKKTEQPKKRVTKRRGVYKKIKIILHD